jgi:hypothetical protein
VKEDLSHFFRSTLDSYFIDCDNFFIVLEFRLDV